MAEPKSIKVKNIPSALGTKDQEELLKLFGAKIVRSVAKTDKAIHVVYATFDTHGEARHALSKLHQFPILNRRLLVEFCKEKDKNHLPKESDFPVFRCAPPDCHKALKVSNTEQLKSEAEEFTRKIHGLCPVLGLDYMPSPLLKYNYPLPNAAIIANISHALVSVPKFYTQVLHLMNKMNLPAPFGPITPAPPLNDEPSIINYKNKEECPSSYMHEVEEMDTGTEEESEIESEDDVANVKIPASVAVKPVQETKKRRKEPKNFFVQPNFVEPKTADSRTEPSAIFESRKIIESSSKKIQFNIKPSLEPQKIRVMGNLSIEGSGFGIIQAQKQAIDADNAGQFGSSSLENPKFISRDELKQKRISASEMKTSSAFRNYSPGEPTVRLYIKNLARQVEEKDLRYVFGRYINWDSETEKNMFDIRLMTEGRMKGQAFVTLANEKQAIEAVRETNGYVLHTKPLVVQFARSAKPKETIQKLQEKDA